MFEESVYKLIEPERPVPEKPKRYKSKYPHDMPPTATTFCLKTTSQTTGNVNGEYQPKGSNHSQKAMGATFGTKRGVAKPETTLFLKKQTGTLKLPESRSDFTLEQKFSYDPAYKKEAIPKPDDKPIMGLVSDKNYIVANAVENILAAPKLPPRDTFDPMSKKTYGKLPKYMQKVKKEIEEEYQLAREMHIEVEQEEARRKYMMGEEERKDLISQLKRKWEVVHKKYQEMTHLSKLDTMGQVRKKESCEKELAQLEKDIQLLQKPYIFVDTTQ